MYDKDVFFKGLSGDGESFFHINILIFTGRFSRMNGNGKEEETWLK